MKTLSPKTRTALLLAGALASVLLVLVLAGLLWKSLGTAPEDPASNVTAEAAHASAQPPGMSPYDEYHGSLMEEFTREVDLALIRSMGEMGLEGDDLDLKLVEVRRAQGMFYHFQIVEVRLAGAPQAFLHSLERNLAPVSASVALAVPAPDALMTKLEAGGNRTGDEEYRVVARHVLVLGRVTHELVFTFPSANTALTYPDVPRAKPDQALLTVIIDDMGDNAAFTREMAELDAPLTISIMPWTAQAEESALAAHQAGREVLIHQPMEPTDPGEHPPGKGVLLVAMNAPELRETLQTNLARVPFARGLNNHMGSRFTQDAWAVAVVLHELSIRDMFVVDSLTHPRSRLADMAEEIGVPVLRRDVFLDVDKDKDAILFQLKKAERIALIHGKAVAIGHPYPETMAALKHWVKHRDKRVRVVPASYLLQSD